MLGGFYPYRNSGTVTQESDSELKQILTFFLAIISTRYVEKTSDVVKLGQVVKCRIISCDAKERKLRLSLVLTGQSEPGQLESIAEAGRVAGRVISKTSDAVVLQLANSSAIASLPKHHLGQAPFQQGAIFDRLRDGAVLDDLLVLHADRARARLTVSANQVLKWADSRGLIPRTFEAIRENAVVVGFVKNLTDYGAFIGFLDDLVGYAKKQDIVAGYSGNPGSVLWLGRPVVARVTSIDHAARRFTLSLANVEIDPDLDRIYISACLEDQDVADLGKWSKGGNLAVEPRVRKALGLFPIGNVVKGAVKEVGKDTVKIELNNGLHGLLAVANAGNKPPAVGETMLCRAVAYDGEKQAVWVVLAEDTTVPRLKKIAVGASKRGTVRLVNGAMVVLELEELRGVLAFASILDLAPRASALRLSVGQVVTFDVVRLPTETGSEDISHAQLTAKRLVVKVSMQSGGTQQAGGGAELKRQIVDPVDPAMSTVDDFSIGKLTKGRIKSVKDSQLNVVLGSNLRGRVHVTEAFDSLDAVPNPKKPLAGFKSGQIVDVKVIGMVSSKNHKYLPITHQNPVSQTVVELTLRTSDLALPDGRLCDANRRPPSDLAHLAPGASLAGFIHEIRDSSLWVHLSSTVQGRIHALDASQDLDVIKELSSHFSLGQGVRCRVVRADHDRKLLDLSLLAPINLDEGSKLAGRIVSVDAVKGLVVQLPEQRYGKVALTDLADRFEEDPTKSFKVGETLIACVVGHDEARHQVDLSLRPSRLAHGGSKSEKPRDPEVMSLDDLSTGQDIRGYVVNVTDKGAFVALGRKVTARLKISEISTDFVKDWQSLVHTGQLLAGKIIGIDAAKGHVEISKKALDQTSSAGAKRLGWPDIEKGMKVDGTVTKVEPFGVFIRIDNSQGISGLCHISEVSNTPVKQLDKLYQPGDAVRAVILKIDLAKKRVSFGLKSTYFEEELADDEDEDEAMDDASEDGDSEEGSAESEADEMEEEGEGASHESDSEDDEDVAEGGSESADSEEEDDVVMVDAGNNEEDDDDEGEDAPLEVSAPFTWDPTAIDRESGPSDQDLSDEDEDEGDHGSDQKKSRRAKRKARKEKEQEVARREEELLDPNRSPETADDFERLILGSPSSSYIWVKYMAFHLQLGEIDRARDVAERALKTIHFREEAEKFNVWIAYLNLENAYGSQDKLDDVFQRACQYNDPKHMHLRMVAIYEQSGKDKLAEELYQSLVKKFKESSKVWVAFGLFYIKRGNIEESRKVLQRAIKSLAKRKRECMRISCLNRCLTMQAAHRHQDNC